MRDTAGLMLNIFVSDLHGNKKKIQKLFSFIKQKKPQGVFLGGDLLPNSYTLDSSMEDFVDQYYVQQIQHVKKNIDTSIRFFFILGNDDPRSFESFFIQAEKEGILDYVHMRTVSFQDYHVTGYAYIPPTPFQLKDWERYDVSRYVDVGSISPEEGIRTTSVNPDEIMYGTMKKDLEKLVNNTPPRKTIFLFHAPPYNTSLDRAALDGKTINHVPVDVHIGSIAIMQFITTYQPLITLHGHVHETVQLTGKWMQKFQDTCSYTAADTSDSLSLICFDPNHPDKGERVRLPL